MQRERVKAAIAPADLGVIELSPAYLCSFCFLLKLFQKLMQKTQLWYALVFFVFVVGILLVRNLLLLLRYIYCGQVSCVNLAAKCCDEA